MQKVGLNNDELQLLVKDLKAGKTWDEVVKDRLLVLAPGVLEASDYKAWAHREAGLTLASPVEDPPADEGEDAPKHRHAKPKR